MRGGDTIGLRAYNERLVIDAIMKAGPLSKAGIARATGLSGQAASVIVNHLLTEGLVRKGEKVRGHVGQPSTPICMNPEGAFAIGVKIGRRSVDAMAVNFLGEAIAERSAPHAAPLPDPTMATACRLAGELRAELGPGRCARLIGVGVAIPSHLEAWSTELGLARGALDGWRETDPAAAISAAVSLPALIVNDAAAACAAEMALGGRITQGCALYLYLGTFIGSGVVLDGKLWRGARANAGAIASMPTCHAAPSGVPTQLIDTGSIITLERRLGTAGITLDAVLGERAPPEAAAIFEGWLAAGIGDVARAVVAALCVIDFEAVVIDGLLPPPLRDRFAARLRAALQEFDLRGLVLPEVTTGSIGPSARVRGAALLPIKARFSPDPDLLVAGRANAAEPSGDELEAP